MYFHFDFLDHSNPYIAKNCGEFLRIFRKYEIETIKPGFYIIQGERTAKDYKSMKAAAEALAVDFSNLFNEIELSWGELADFGDIFTTLGTRYGLLKDFHENAIC